MKQRLKLHLWRTNCTVHMQVLEQEGITESLSDKVKALRSVTIFNDSIYLRGEEKWYDNYIANHLCKSEQEAFDYINKVVSWLDEVFPPKEPERGDVVLVKHDNYDEYSERIFLSKINGSKKPYICLDSHYEYKFRNGLEFEIIEWKYMKPLTTNWDSETGIYEAERDV